MTDLNKMTEEQVYEYWVNNNIFPKSIEANKSKPEFVFYDGPPFMTGSPHYGHILAGMIKDSVLRYFHNKGMNVPRFGGIDTHGLPIEYEIEKELGIKTTQQVEEFGIGNYNEACRNIVSRCADIWEQQMGRLGRWIDFKNQYKTMDLNFMNSVWWVFKNLYEKGRIYEGVKIMGYSTSCGTPLSNFEIQQNYQEVQDDSLFIKIQLKSNFIEYSNVNILVWTTTPWTLPSNYALCVGSNIDYVLVEFDDNKYICGEKLIGNIFGKKLPKILNKFKGLELVGLEYQPVFEFNNYVEKYKIIGGSFVTDSDGTGIVHCFDPETPVLMYDYTVKKIKDIKIGDKVWGDDNKPRNIIGLIPRTNGDMYDVEQNNGVKYSVSENHILVLKASGISPTISKINNNKYCVCIRKRCNDDNCPKKCKGFKKIIYKKFDTYEEANQEKNNIQKSDDPTIVKNNDIFEMTVLEYLNICTQDCQQRLRGFKSNYPTIKNNDNINLPIPPYLLGLWLGDGSTNDVRITGTDKEVERYLNDYCKTVDMRLSITKINSSDSQIIKQKKECFVWRISSNKKGEKNKFKSILKDLGILNNKHIPEIYMNASETDRFLLLAGLIDTDGCLYVNENKINFEFQQSNHREELVFQVSNLAKSLGISVGKMSKYYYNASRFNKDKFEDGEKNHYACKIRFFGENILKIPTLTPRKQAFNLCKQKSFNNSNTSLIKITKSIKNEFMGITVDGNGRFLLDDLTVVHNCAPAYGHDDYQVCLDNGLITRETKLFQPLDTNGFVTDAIPELKGMFYKNFKDKSSQDLNTWVVIDLKKKGFYYDKRTFKHNYPFCWRSDTPLIYCAVNSWFVKVEDMRDKLCELNSQINWVPKSVGESRFANWLGAAKDWGVSRNRFWGTPIPIWKSDSGDVICVGSSYELEKLAGLEYGSITDLHRHNIDHIEIVKDGKVYRRESAVLDCWFESGAMPYGTVGRIGIVELLEKHCKLSDSGLKFDTDGSPYILTDNFIKDDNCIQPTRERFSILPADFIAEGLDQTRGWFYTLLVLSTSLFEMTPFKNVIVNGLILAEDGKKMSKRLKNYPDPMDIVKEYGSDALRLYLLGSQATRAEPLKFSKSGVHEIVKDILIPLSNTIVFWKEYMELFLNTNNSNPIISIKNNIKSITNPINLWILRKYSELRDEFNLYMSQYNLKNAVGILYKLVQIMNNGYIKMARQLIKGKESQEEWIQSLSVLSYIIGFMLNDFKSIIPFFSESKYQELKLFYINKLKLYDFFDESIHLVESQEFVKLGPEQIAKSIDFDIIYNMIIQIYQMRSMNDISLKKPVKQVSLIWDIELEQRYSDRFKQYLNMVMEECNLLDLKILSKSEVDIKKTIVPVKSLFFKTYGKEISLTFEEICKMDTENLEKIISDGEYNGFVIEPTLFNFNYNVKLQNICSESSDLIYKEFNFGEFKDKIIIIMDKSWTESNDKIYYYRLVATSIQKSRKNAGLHPWDEINALWEGQPKFDLDSDEAQNYINNITRIKLLKYQNSCIDIDENLSVIKNNLSRLIYSNEFENIGIKIHLSK